MTEDSPYAQTRRALIKALRDEDIYVSTSEELLQRRDDYPIDLQELAHVQAHDVTFAIPSSPGSNAEVQMVFSYPTYASKLVIFYDSAWDAGFANQRIATGASAIRSHSVGYNTDQLPEIVVSEAKKICGRLRAERYLSQLGGRQ